MLVRFRMFFSDMQLLDVVSVMAVWLSGAGLLQAYIFESHQQPQATTFFVKVTVHFTFGHSYVDAVGVNVVRPGYGHFFVVMLGLWCGAWHCWHFCLSVAFSFMCSCCSIGMGWPNAWATWHVVCLVACWCCMRFHVDVAVPGATLL